MKTFLILTAIFAALFFAQPAVAGETIPPAEAANRVAAGKAILIDVREPNEWTGGVVTGVLLLPLSDLRGERKLWKPVLEASRDKALIVYCRSGNRSAQAVAILEKENFKATNAGGFADWKSAGQPVAMP
jgi:rhodanese-related sulfurtransferase